MDDRTIEYEGAAQEAACYRAASIHGLTQDQADNCDNGDRGCAACPFKKARRGRPPGSRNKKGTPKINVHYRIDSRIDAALRRSGTVAGTLEQWAARAGDDVLSTAGCDGPGVYTITNVLTGRQYIGASVNMLERWRDHRNMLRSGRHGTPRLQEAWNTDGEVHFRFGVLLAMPDTTRGALLDAEREFIDACVDPYNAGQGGPRLGFGGKQPGAGRKAGPVTGPRAIVLSASAVVKLDALRGATPRSEFVEGLIEAQQSCSRSDQEPPCGECGGFLGSCNC